jgi:hypothetical protein
MRRHLVLTRSDKSFKVLSQSEQHMSSQRVVRIDFFTHDTLPQPLRAAAEAQGTKLGKGLVAVKTIVSSPPSYDFATVGNSPEEIQSFMESLAKEDGVELGTTVQKAFREE